MVGTVTVPSNNLISLADVDFANKENVGSSLNMSSARNARVESLNLCVDKFFCLFVCLLASFLKIGGNVYQRLGHDPGYPVGS